MSGTPWAWLSSSLFHSAEFADAWIGLPRKVSESLHFRQNWRNFFTATSPRTQPTLWIHGASVGELEDLTDFFTNSSLLKDLGFSPSDIVVTASSVSAKDKLMSLQKLGLAYSGPLPPENPREIQSFFYLLRPQCLLMSHTDIWPVALAEACNYLEKGCVWLPSRWPSSENLFRSTLFPLVKAVGYRSEEFLFSLKNFLDRKPLLAHWIGNPRIDRILSRIEASRRAQKHPLLPWNAAPLKEKISLLVGSCWLEDAQVLAAALSECPSHVQQSFQIVVIPHETKDPHGVAAMQSLLPWARVLSIQGVLAEAYQDFQLAFVGGGYRSGLHNVLEPALWEVPVLTGPLLRHQPEAKQLQREGLLHVMPDAIHLRKFLTDFLDPSFRAIHEQNARKGAESLRKHEGANLRLMKLIQESWSDHT